MKKLQSSIAYNQWIQRTIITIVLCIHWYNALFISHLWYGIVAWGGIRAGNLQRICWFKKRAPCSMTILINLEYNESCRKTFYVLNVMAVIYCTLFYVWEVLCCVLTEKIYKEAQICTLPFCHTPDTHPDPTCPSTTALCPCLRRSLHTSGRRSTTYYLKKEGKQLETALNNWMINSPLYSMEELINGETPA